MSRLRQDFTTITWVMIPVAIAINIAIGTLIYAVKFPFVYLDMIGTVLVGVLCGPWAGLLTGLLSNLIWGLSGLNPIYIPYFIVGGVIGFLAGWFSQWGWFASWWKSILAGVITGVAAAALSAPITAYLYGAVTGAGTDVVTAFFPALGLLVLGALANIRSTEALKLVIPYVGDDSLGLEASLAASKISAGRTETKDEMSSARVSLAFLESMVPSQHRARLEHSLGGSGDDVPPEGFRLLFNGKNLDGWRGLVENPIARSRMDAARLAAAQAMADSVMRAHWTVADGILLFDGKGESLCSAEDLGDFELLVDWKIGKNGDSGIYLRGMQACPAPPSSLRGGRNGQIVQARGSGRDAEPGRRVKGRRRSSRPRAHPRSAVAPGPARAPALVAAVGRAIGARRAGVATGRDGVALGTPAGSIPAVATVVVPGMAAPAVAVPPVVTPAMAVAVPPVTPLPTVIVVVRALDLEPPRIGGRDRRQGSAQDAGCDGGGDAAGWI